MNDSDAPRPRRLWYQFRLRTLLVFAVVAGIGLGWVGSRLNRARKNRQAVTEVFEVKAKIQSVGAMVRIEEPEQSPSRLDKLFGDPAGVPRIVCVNAHAEGRRYSDSEMEYLKGRTSVEELCLIHTQVTDAGLVHLKGLTNLKTLMLSNTRVTDGGLVHLKGLTNLERLDLWGTQVTDAGLENLRGLPNLKFLDIAFTLVTDEGLKELQQALPNCEIRHSRRRKGIPGRH